ncbi:uncharacterized protein GGQ54_002823 [Naumannella cuiyingiana]|uniref:DUF177 domain-containing protein n=1 Tax=Naumannella cuiyingiana TaxID=1347891 RepID=A0A7Z0DB63_9ACTN|nr:DUF177 domain-containing protein [Naumannella cuiyingiana]NYI72263.1 uncharacterized protein [Naumannella cuiyingiana]
MSSSRRHPDPRSGLVLDTHNLHRQAGVMREVRERVEAPEGLGNDVIGVPTGAPIDLELRLEAVVEGVLVTGEARFEATGQCGRCLEPVTEQVVIDIQELYVYPGNEADGEDASRLDGELADLEPLVRDEALLELPFMPVCRADCAGLCPDCGANLNADPGHDHGPSTDPRWAGLSGWGERGPADN